MILQRVSQTVCALLLLLISYTPSLVVVNAQEEVTLTGAGANETMSGCAGDPCTDPDKYCWNSTRPPWNTTACIPTTFACGGSSECQNNPTTVCNLDRGACQSLGDICDGVRDVAANCADETVFSRWTLAKDGIRTLKVKDICMYEPGTCGEPVPTETKETESGAAPAQQFTTTFTAMMSMMMGGAMYVL